MALERNTHSCRLGISVAIAIGLLALAVSVIAFYRTMLFDKLEVDRHDQVTERRKTWKPSLSPAKADAQWAAAIKFSNSTFSILSGIESMRDTEFPDGTFVLGSFLDEHDFYYRRELTRELESSGLSLDQAVLFLGDPSVAGRSQIVWYEPGTKETLIVTSGVVYAVVTRD